MPRVVHFEIHADSPKRAIEFYANTFDWKVEKWEGPEDYWLIVTGPVEAPGINGGILQRREPVEGNGMQAYVCTIDVPSVDEYMEKVKENGGTVVAPKMAIPGVGWLAYCLDTEGNIFGIMTSDMEAK